MTTAAGFNRPKLAWLVSSRIMIAASLAFLIQIVACLAENFRDESYFGGWYVELETDRIRHALKLHNGAIAFVETPKLAHYRGKQSEQYGFRVIARNGKIIAVSNSKLMQRADIAGADRSTIPDKWFRHLDAGNWFHLAGGTKTHVGGEPVWIEVATLGDPAQQRYYALWKDLIDDVIIPVFPTIFLLSVFAIFSVYRALRPLESASRLAEHINGRNIEQCFPVNNLPREAARFCDAINKLLARLSGLINAQRFFISRAAHELRTPLGIMLLELGKMQGDRARRVESDVDGMTSTINRMLQLARMDVLDAGDLVEITPSEIPEGVIRELAPLAEERQTAISWMTTNDKPFQGDLASIREALLNLVENAIEHSPKNSRVLVRCGPGASFAVEDDGPGLPPDGRQQLFEPFYRANTATDGSGLGLAIVRRTVELHGASVDVEESSLGGTRIRLRFLETVQEREKLGWLSLAPMRQ